MMFRPFRRLRSLVKWMFVLPLTLIFGGWLALAMLSYLGTSMVCFSQLMSVRTGLLGFGSADEYPSFHRAAFYRGYTLIAFTRTPYDPPPKVPFRSEWIFRFVAPVSFSLLSPIDATGQGFAVKIGSRRSQNDGTYVSADGQRAGPAPVSFDAYLLLPPWFTFLASSLGLTGITALWLVPFLRVRPKLRRWAVSGLGVAIGIACCTWLVWATVWYSQGSRVSLDLCGDSVAASGLMPAYHPWHGSLEVFTQSGNAVVSVASAEMLGPTPTQTHFDFGLETLPPSWRVGLFDTNRSWAGFGFSNRIGPSMASSTVRARHGAALFGPTRTVRKVGLIVPAWFGYSASILGLIVGLTLVGRWRRKARHRDPLARPCPNCRYDMRSTPERCSECGYVKVG
jgi:hypothetical protein